jgi:uncharacterized protein (DUF433 family)
MIERGRGPQLAGTRVTVYDIYPYLEDGDWSLAEIADSLQLSPEQVQVALRYIEAHKEEVLAVHRRIEERNARGNPPEIEAMRQATRARMHEWLEEHRRMASQEGNEPRREF